MNEPSLIMNGVQMIIVGTLKRIVRIMREERERIVKNRKGTAQ
jgi:hypothetical protein